MTILICLAADAAPAQQERPAAAPASSAEAQPAATPQKPSPRCDAACVRTNMDRAAQICARRIESEAPIDFDWVTRPFGGIFQEADPSSAENSVVLYRGDSIRFLNPQKEWVRVSYQCAFDVAEGAVKDLRIRPGQLNRPGAAQAAPSIGAPAGGAASSAAVAPPRSAQPLAGPRPQPGGAAQEPKLDSATLAAAIQQAAQKRQTQKAGAPPPAPKPPKMGEKSAIEFTQMPYNNQNEAQ